MMPSVHVDGRPVAAVSARDRGLQFGDGLFETMAVVDGRIRLMSRHMKRLRTGLHRLQITFTLWDELYLELATLAAQCGHGVLKLIVTRGNSDRGYAAAAHARPRRIVYLGPWPVLADRVRLHVCETRLGSGGALAGIKHLNRLEQVLGRLEVDAVSGCDDGLMLDAEDRVIETTRANLFIVSGNRVVTPSLQRAGVAGVMRALLLELLDDAGQPATVSTMSLQQVMAADEVFTTNSLAVVTPVASLHQRDWPHPGPVTQQLSAHLQQWLQADAGQRCA